MLLRGNWYLAFVQRDKQKTCTHILVTIDSIKIRMVEKTGKPDDFWVVRMRGLYKISTRQRQNKTSTKDLQDQRKEYSASHGWEQKW